MPTSLSVTRRRRHLPIAAMASILSSGFDTATRAAKAVTPLPSYPVRSRQVSKSEQMARDAQAFNLLANRTLPAYRRRTTNPKKLRRLARRHAVV